MAKTTKGIKFKMQKVSIDMELVNQNQSCPRRATKTQNLTKFHSIIHSKTPLYGSTPRLHSINYTVPFEKVREVGLNIFIHINGNKHINKQYITMVYDGIQKEAIRLIRTCFPKSFREVIVSNDFLKLIKLYQLSIEIRIRNTCCRSSFRLTWHFSINS